MNAALRIDLNCDMGESFGVWRLGDDEAVMPLITSANIACGGHAGDPNVMERTLRLAQQHRVSAGAHPGFPDLGGFGRRKLMMPPEDVRRMVLAQVGALYGIGRGLNVEIRHVKPHGALYNVACAESPWAEAVAEAVREFSRALALFCLPGSALSIAGLDKGLTVVHEGFADRLYEPTGHLANRDIAGSVLGTAEEVALQALSLAHGYVTARDGTHLETGVGTICVHGDSPGVVENLRAIHRQFGHEEIRVVSPWEI